MSSIRVRPNAKGKTRHEVRWRDADGISRSLTFDNPEGAAKWRKLLDQVGPDEALRIAQVTPSATALTTVTDWCETYIGQLTGVQEGTRRRYRTIVTHDITPAIGALPLQVVTEATIAGWVQGLEGSGKTIANKHGFLSGCLAAAVRAGHITANPCEGRRLPRTEREEMCFLEPGDFALLLHYITDPWKPLVTLLVSTGLRWGEATALRVGDVDADKATVRVVRAWKYTSGEGHRIGPPKSRKSVRTVRLSPQTMDAVAPLLSRDADELLFTNTRGGAVRSATFHDNVWQPAVRLANGEPAAGAKRIARRKDADGNVLTPAPEGMRLGKRPRIHDLRHSYASWLIHGGVPLPVIQQTLGHESITTTIGTYGHLDTRSMDVATTVISSALTQALPDVLPALPSGMPAPAVAD